MSFDTVIPNATPLEQKVYAHISDSIFKDAEVALRYAEIETDVEYLHVPVLQAEVEVGGESLVALSTFGVGGSETKGSVEVDGRTLPSRTEFICLAADDETVTQARSAIAMLSSFVDFHKETFYPGMAVSFGKRNVVFSSAPIRGDNWSVPPLVVEEGGFTVMFLYVNLLSAKESTAARDVTLLPQLRDHLNSLGRNAFSVGRPEAAIVSSDEAAAAEGDDAEGGEKQAASS